MPASGRLSGCRLLPTKPPRRLQEWLPWSSHRLQASRGTLSARPNKEPGQTDAPHWPIARKRTCGFASRCSSPDTARRCVSGYPLARQCPWPATRFGCILFCEDVSDATAHAEVEVIRKACAKLKQNRLRGFDLYVTLEPCTMCAAAISFARIENLYFGAEDKKGGAVLNGVKFFDAPTCHHKPKVFSGILAEESSLLLKDFFKQKR